MLLVVSITFVLIVTVLVIANVGAPRKKLHLRIASLYTSESAQFRRTMGTLMGPAILDGNRVTPLQNGDAIFPAMLEAIRGATRTVTFETFIYWSGDIGRRFAEALIDRAQAGVRVHVLLDWIGSKELDQESIAKMENAGVIVEKFHPLRWYNLGRLNNRTHRKILVVDGTVGFTGGVGIADQWLGDARTEEEWRDSHFRIEGPAVAQLQAAFLDNWHTTNAEVLHGADYFPSLSSHGDVAGQMFKSSPQEGSGSVRLMYMLAIAAAKKHIRIAVAYFVPDDLAIELLLAARNRGVVVELIVPGPKIDTKVTRRASRACWGALLQGGVHIYEFQPTMFHCKYMIIDDELVSVGSTNFDDRSFRINREANFNAFDRAFAASQIAVFENDKKRAARVDYETWKRRPLREKAIEHLASLVRSQL